VVEAFAAGLAESEQVEKDIEEIEGKTTCARKSMAEPSDKGDNARKTQDKTRRPQGTLKRSRDDRDDGDAHVNGAQRRRKRARMA